MSKFIVATLLLFSFSLSAFADEENYIIKTKPKANFTVIKQPCYVDVNVNYEDVENLKKKDEEASYVAWDDHNFYNSNAMEAAEKEKIKSCFYEQEQPRYLVFILNNGKEIYVDSKSLFWKWILFNGKEIKIIYPIDIEQEVLKDFYN